MNYNPHGLHWTEHYVKYGFAIVRGLVDRDFCDAAVQRVREIINNDLPLDQWTKANTPELYQGYVEGCSSPEPLFQGVFDQPRLIAALDELFGAPRRWNQKRNCYLFLKPYDPDSPAQLTPHGHIDFPNQLVPILYRGCVYQVSLIDSEPFSGNITFYPGTHKLVQKLLMEQPDTIFPAIMPDIPLPEPVEFVAQAGDVAFYHHLVLHEGNPSHAAGRTPRIAITCEAFCESFLKEVDPANSNLSPWERSLALNGPYRETRDEIEDAYNVKREEYFESMKR